MQNRETEEKSSSCTGNSRSGRSRSATLCLSAGSDDNQLILIKAMCNALRTREWHGTSKVWDAPFELVCRGIKLFTATKILDNTGLHVKVCDAYMTIVDKTNRYLYFH
ncbi:hypothetical protein CAEBREN_04410 [Caenorhabditis brenneri]|uniref:Uncharacterized protein n=1 Tax=Caenorhabditis brenneri TaxID=135651 RepID=G0NZL0_CAEBE|nr:hypothetical protein CAEBREN_04410 [Caenorhabditis brenneri]